MRITFVRHGMTEMNRKDICQSGEELVNSKGIIQAKQVAEALKSDDFDIAFVSIMMRAQQTAEEILKFHPDTKKIDEKEIREHENGAWVGKPKRWRREEKEKLAKEIGKEHYQIRPPGGESVEDLRDRVRKWLDKTDLTKYDSILIVSHGAAIVFMLEYFLGFDLSEYNKYAQKYCEITVIEEKNGKFELIKNKENKHLK